MNKALFHQRLIAKGIDFFIVYFAIKDNEPFWIIMSILYLLICDGFFQGQSIGKRIVGLKTVYWNTHTKEYLPSTFIQSAIRNCGFSAILFLSIIPGFLGYLFAILGCVAILLEVYFLYTDTERMRIGDIYAKTKVIQVKMT